MAKDDMATMDVAIDIAHSGPWYRCLECDTEGHPRDVLATGPDRPPRCRGCILRELTQEAQDMGMYE